MLEKFNFILIILIGVTLAGCSTHASNWKEWDTEKRTVFAASNIALVADWSTTINITKRYDENYYETNPILGKHPSEAHVVAYFIARGIAHYHLTNIVPAKYRNFFHGYNIIYNYNTVKDNHELGIRIGF